MKSLKIPINQVRATGGGARSKIWLKILADIFNLEIVTVNVSEGGALGVALLAGAGVKIFKDIKGICKSIIKVTSKVTPEAGSVKIYDDYYKMYKKTYQVLKGNFKELIKLK